MACQTERVAPADTAARSALLRRGFALEYVTLAWNMAGIVVLAIAATSARSVALAGFGLDSLIEIGASTVVIWELSGTGEERQRRGLRLIGYAFAALAVYLLVQSTGYDPRHSVPGIIWTAATAVVMFALAAGKARTGRALDNPVLRTEGRVTMIDGILELIRSACGAGEVNGTGEVLDVMPSLTIKSIGDLSIGFRAQLVIARRSTSARLAPVLPAQMR